MLIDAAPAPAGRRCCAPSPRALAGRDDLELVVLLIDERPEEVAAWRDAAPGAELAVATGDMRTGEQLRLVELAFGRATRRAEAGTDVVLLVDSLSRIAVAADDPGRVKPIFGAGRETAEEDLGALTVIATALRDGATSDAAAEALETTENTRLVLDPELAAAGVYPAIDVGASPDRRRGASCARRPSSRRRARCAPSSPGSPPPTPPRACASGSRLAGQRRPALLLELS